MAELQLVWSRNETFKPSSKTDQYIDSWNHINIVFFNEHDYSDSWKTFLDLLLPHFPNDEILPYSFLATLNSWQLISLLQSLDEVALTKLPLDGVLACTEYHLKENNYLDTVVGH